MSKAAKKASADNTAKKLPAHKIPELQFKPGQSGNPNGRPKSSRNKLGEAFLEALNNDFTQHGVKAIETVRTERPHEYLKVVASILPKELNVNTRAVEEMSDDDLAAGIAALQSLIASQGAGARSDTKTKH